MKCMMFYDCSQKMTYLVMSQNPDREFILKFSAMEIYNEIVRDLLSTDNTPLRLLDDPMVNLLAYFFRILLALSLLVFILLNGY